MADNETKQTVHETAVSKTRGRLRIIIGALGVFVFAIGFGANGLLAPPRAAQPVPRRSEPSIFMPSPQQLSMLAIEPVKLMLFHRENADDAKFEFDAGDDFLSPAIPESAIVDEGETARVWVATSDGVLALREVQTGRFDGDMVEVIRGLSAGERIVVRGAMFLDSAADTR